MTDMTGKVFGELTVIGMTEPPGKRRAICRCSCGNQKLVLPGNLGTTRSCGCKKKEWQSAANVGRVNANVVTHGDTRGDEQTTEYGRWATMLSRCENPKSTGYENYGGRGIAVCEQWHTFENFLADMGRCPEGFSIERKNNMLGYSPENCVWASRETQQRNRRNNRMLEHDGLRLCVADWTDRLGWPQHIIRQRLAESDKPGGLVKWPISRILTEQPGAKSRRFPERNI